MGRERITELHYIAPLANLESIFDKGILSHNEAEPFKKADVSMQEVQNIRAHKVIPASAMGSERKIHDCANVYLNAKNPMLFCRQKEKENICVLRLKSALVDLPEAVIADRNAAANEARFFKAAEGVHQLAENILFGQFWTSKNNDEATNRTNGQLRCAELLLPHKIHPSYIAGMYVASEAVKQAVLAKFPEGCPVEITVHPAFFFEQKAITPYIPQLGNKRFPNPIDFAPEPPPAPPAPPSPPIVRNIVVIAPAPQSTTHTSPKRGIEQWLVKTTKDKKVVPYESKITLPPHITLKRGNLLDSPMQTLVNTVNCKGAMGAGIALAFKTRFKSMFNDYKERCEKAEVKPGTPYIYEEDGKKIINFPTKDHWRDKSRLAWIKQGLDLLKSDLQKWGIISIAIPPLGCGNGGLDWQVVRKMIVDTFRDVENIQIEIYEPHT